MMLPKVDAIVVFVQDLEACTKFYRDTLGLPKTFDDAVSIGFKLGTQDFLLLKRSAAAEMVGEEALVKDGARVLLCAGVKNVDDTYKEMTAKGIAFLKVPVDKPWGRRVAYFADPEGNLWELFHELPAK